MKYSELYQLLRRGHCIIEREGAGHTIWFSPATGRKFTVPWHRNENITEGTLHLILKTAGLSQNEEG